jgi:hypothetical protein
MLKRILPVKRPLLGVALSGLTIKGCPNVSLWPCASHHVHAQRRLMTTIKEDASVVSSPGPISSPSPKIEPKGISHSNQLKPSQSLRFYWNSFAAMTWVQRFFVVTFSGLVTFCLILVVLGGVYFLWGPTLTEHCDLGTLAFLAGVACLLPLCCLVWFSALLYQVASGQDLDLFP